jgi:hypothetical protein
LAWGGVVEDGNRLIYGIEQRDLGSELGRDEGAPHFVQVIED